MNGITDRQRKILNFIEKYSQKNSYPPTIKEISEKVNMPLASVHHSLLSLRKKAYIDWIDEKPRTIRIIKKGA